MLSLWLQQCTKIQSLNYFFNLDLSIVRIRSRARSVVQFVYIFLVPIQQGIDVLYVLVHRYYIVEIVNPFVDSSDFFFRTFYFDFVFFDLSFFIEKCFVKMINFVFAAQVLILEVARLELSVCDFRLKPIHVIGQNRQIFSIVMQLYFNLIVQFQERISILKVH